MIDGVEVGERGGRCFLFLRGALFFVVFFWLLFFGVFCLGFSVCFFFFCVCVCFVVLEFVSWGESVILNDFEVSFVSVCVLMVLPFAKP